MMMMGPNQMEPCFQTQPPIVGALSHFEQGMMPFDMRPPPAQGMMPLVPRPPPPAQVNNYSLIYYSLSYRLHLLNFFCMCVCSICVSL
ncbi:hypothetical protein MKW98_031056 [Papaver atlanticum]|uniref:Uncharacterized protein n=1 Tax=Papaver atlanticum TaxID=357466 RepID=A0AAD4XLR6_9MAGN|nr:hypothetical protein MKW98_031056 [Papaver atlanticum]